VHSSNFTTSDITLTKLLECHHHINNATYNANNRRQKHISAALFKLMYKTAVYRLANCGIAYQKQIISEKEDIMQHDTA